MSKGVPSGELAQRSRTTFEAFYRTEYETTLAVVLALRGPRTGPEEVTQEAFLRAYRDWETVGSLDDPAHWVRRVAVNLATSRWRRLGAEARALLRVGRQSHASTDATARVDADDRFWQLVRMLPREQQRVVSLYYAANLDVSEVAATLDKAPGTVKATLYQARSKLEDHLAEEEGA